MGRRAAAAARRPTGLVSPRLGPLLTEINTSLVDLLALAAGRAPTDATAISVETFNQK